MAPKLEIPRPDTLLAEQEASQAHTLRGRLLAEYNSYIFPGQEWREPRSCAITDFLRPLCHSETISLDSVLEGVYAANGTPVRWVDMGGGRGLPMRELASDPASRERLVMTNVDLFDLGLEGLEANEVEYLKELKPGMTNTQAAPCFIQANAETVILPEPADVITSIEAMQYLNDPLAAISNWYNQLADNGVLIISARRNWAGWIRYQREGEQSDRDATPTKLLLDELNKAGIAHAASYECDWEGGFRSRLDPSCFCNLVIQKRSGTTIVVNSAVAGIWVNPYGFKAAYYEEPKPGARPLIEVITA